MSSALKHDSVSCPFCEAIPPDAYRRHWKRERPAGYWHTIADGRELMHRLSPRAHFLTILAYRPGADGFPAHYYGPFYGECDAEDPAQAFADFRRCVQLLETEYGCPPEAVRIWHSGHRGPHWTIPPVVIGAEAGHPLLPQIYEGMIERLFPLSVAPTLDRAVYSKGKGRMWRLPNRRRSDNGRYKVPLSVRELLHKPYEALERLTHRPRTGNFWPSKPELSPCLGLVQLYREVAATVERTGAHARPPDRPTRNLSGKEGLLFYVFRDRGWLGQAITPGKWAVACPWEDQHTNGERFDTSTILFASDDGDTLGWLHCSHAHCQGRAMRDVLAIFSTAELGRAKDACGVPERPYRFGVCRTTGQPPFRTMSAENLMGWRAQTISAQEPTAWRQQVVPDEGRAPWRK
jgi:hypothetical protein